LSAAARSSFNRRIARTARFNKKNLSQSKTSSTRARDHRQSQSQSQSRAPSSARATDDALRGVIRRRRRAQRLQPTIDAVRAHENGRQERKLSTVQQHPVPTPTTTRPRRRSFESINE
jgi:hypothetical protein